MVSASTRSRGGVFPPALDVVGQVPNMSLVEEVVLPVAIRRTIPTTASRTTTPTLAAKMIHPVLVFLREPFGSVLLDVSAMMPKIRLGMPMKKQVLSMVIPGLIF